MSSWFLTALFAVLIGGATVLMLVILVGLCTETANSATQDTAGWRTKLRPLWQVQVTGTRKLDS